MYELNSNIYRSSLDLNGSRVVEIPEIYCRETFLYRIQDATDKFICDKMGYTRGDRNLMLSILNTMSRMILRGDNFNVHSKLSIRLLPDGIDMLSDHGYQSVDEIIKLINKVLSDVETYNPGLKGICGHSFRSSVEVGFGGRESIYLEYKHSGIESVIFSNLVVLVIRSVIYYLRTPGVKNPIEAIANYIPDYYYDEDDVFFLIDEYLGALEAFLGMSDDSTHIKLLSTSMLFGTYEGISGVFTAAMGIKKLSKLNFAGESIVEDIFGLSC